METLSDRAVYGDLSLISGHARWPSCVFSPSFTSYVVAVSFASWSCVQELEDEKATALQMLENAEAAAGPAPGLVPRPSL